eukprot:scaffold3256_cov444-Prasinococcus_capsulatus_cf.AAC.6
MQESYRTSLRCITWLTSAFGTLLGTVLAYWVLNLGANVHEAWKIAASLCARHIGYGQARYALVDATTARSQSAL